MTLGSAEDLDDLRQVTRRFLAAKSDSAAVRALLESGADRDPEVWAQMAGQLGLQGLAVPENYDGAGLGPVELGVVLEEMGRALFTGPYFSTVALAAQTLTAVGDSAAMAAHLPRIASGELTATVAVADATGDFHVAGVTTTAELDGATWLLHGEKRFVIDGAAADLLLIAARVGDEVGLFAIEGAADGLTRAPIANLDLTRPFATLSLDAAPATRVGGDVSVALERAGDLAAAALAAEQVGGASRVLEMAVDYAKIRVQFDRPIGSFQAIKHKCADLLIEIESARSAASFAAALLADEDPEGPVAASAAAAWCAAAFTHAAKENIQIHGGIGFTWEHDAHWYLKRAKASELLLGTPRQHRERVAELTGI